MNFATRTTLIAALLASLASLTACDGNGAQEPQAKLEAVSILGDPLYPLEHTDPSFEANLLKAEAEHAANPQSEEAAIWHGRRLAYLDRYQEAIEVYTAALEIHPDSVKLLRHRGHRYITTRQFSAAIGDLSRAAELADALEDEIEPDGLPNARNEPRSTLKFNIWYHLGLAYFFNDEISQAYSAFGQTYQISKRNPDLLCAATHWLYLTTRRLGLDEDADLLLDGFNLEMDVIENEDYLHLLLFYRGFYTAEQMMDVTDPTQRATRGFGVAHFFLVNDEQDRANDLFLDVVQEGHWPAFGAIAAEVELSRIE